MAASVVEILSSALVELGEDRITSADQDTERARIVSEVYPTERDALLEEHPWKFATARAELALLADAPAFGFANAFALPSDCLHVMETWPETHCRVEGGRLLADAPAMAVRYVRRVTNPTLMPPTFRAALSARIAAKVAKKITGSSAEKERMLQLYADRLKTAKSRDAQGGGQPEPQDLGLFGPNRFIQARVSGTRLVPGVDRG